MDPKTLDAKMPKGWQAGVVAAAFPNRSTAQLHVSATADTPATKNGTEVVSVFDSGTGETVIVAKEKAAPWLALVRGNEVYAGIEAGRFGMRVPVAYRRDFLRIKDVWLSGTVEVDFPAEAAARAEWRAGVGAAYRW